MFDVFDLPFVQHGVVELLALAVGAGLIGTWIVLRGLAFFSHAVGTAAFPGLVLADGLGFAPELGAAATGLLVAGAVAALARSRAGQESYDSLTALVLVGALAVGIVLASDVFGSGGRVDSLLFGSLLVVAPGDIAVAAVASAAVLLGTLLLGARWLVTGFDPSSAPALGVRSAWPDVVLLTLVAFVGVASLSTLGALLSTAIIVVPAATTRLLCERLVIWQLATIVLAALEGVAGLWLSVEWNAPPGPAIAVLTGAVFAVALLLRGRATLLARRRARTPEAVAA